MRTASIDIARIDSEEAIRVCDAVLGETGEWAGSPLLHYRWAAEFQGDWKSEVGQWLTAARVFGFDEAMVERLIRRTRRPSRSKEVDPNDQRHLEFVQEIAPATLVHFLTGTGWTFEAWEPMVGGAVDVDVCLRSPSGVATSFQVKAPDQPGVVRGHRVVNGEFDERVIRAMENAARQLVGAPGARVIAISAQRRVPLTFAPDPVTGFLFGDSCSDPSRSYVYMRRPGRFFDDDWNHVDGVLLLDLVRTDVPVYFAHWYPNPRKSSLAGSDFRATRCVLRDGVYRWEPESAEGKGARYGIPHGTRVERG
ncbi:MAG: hypothetical protein H6723_19065 [Sandaracinus sp.]|nr:hypothetical protein [Sandaracinus sp.]